MKKAGKSEEQIEDAIIQNLDKLGFKNADIIRRLRLPISTGFVDLAIFPKDGPYKVVLIEAKSIKSDDAKFKVVGQILMYYAAVLQYGQTGLTACKDYAITKKSEAQSVKKSTPKAITGKSPPILAFQQLFDGEKLKPSEVKLYVAFDGGISNAAKWALELLRKNHNLDIGVIAVENGKLEVMYP